MARPRLSVTPPPDDDSTSSAIWRTGDQVPHEDPQWLLPNRIVANGLCIVEGDSSAGKSTFLAHLAAAVTTGRSWLGRCKAAPAHVLWLNAEESYATLVRPRLLAAQAHEPFIHTPGLDENGILRHFYLPSCIRLLRDAIGAFGLRLIIIEPLVSYTDSSVNLSLEMPARSVVDPLNRLAMDTGCCVVVTRGLRKDRSGPRTGWGSGNGAIGQSARSVLHLERPDELKQRRVLRSFKCGGAGTPAPAIEYVHDVSEGAPRIESLQEIIGPDDPVGDAVDIGDSDTRADARELLRSVCATDYVPTNDILAMAKKSMIGERTLRKVKAELLVHSRWNRKVGTGFHEWGPPLGGWEAPPITTPVQPKKRAALPKKPRKSRAKKPE